MATPPAQAPEGATAHDPVESIRAASRTLVRELGFMRATLAATEYSPSAVHALLEIEANGHMTAAQLVQVLALEKSSVSRMLARLVAADELRESSGHDDARLKQLHLTARGRRTVRAIHAHGRAQVMTALQRLNPSQQQAVVQGLHAYAGALRACRDADPVRSTGLAPIAVEAGYRPGLIGRVTEMHASFYARHWGFGAIFESRVAAGLADFSQRLHEPCNGLWVATQGGRIVGSVAIDGQDLGAGLAHLRWFILDDGCRGGGAGRRLLHEAIAFCDRVGFEATQLWTFRGLDAARRLYESCGFELTHEAPGDQWGTQVVEQQFTRRRPAPSA
ncbi:MAG: MarR family transcriptional regulator [Burkholderiaceae bacterium]|nr:MarR family transcriptional regulator [Burkholderiaceae bacterium]